MTPGFRSALWLASGFVISPILGFFAFWFLGFVVGGGIDLEGTSSPSERFFNSLALPSLIIVPFTGMMLGLFMCIQTLRRRD